MVGKESSNTIVGLMRSISQNSMNVLIADDHEVVRKGVCSILESRDNLHVCGEANNGEEAIKKAQQLNPDLIILDVTMPVRDGFSAASQIKEMLPNVPILMLSMHDGRSMVRAAQAAGAQGFVTKADVAGVLLKAVDALLQGQTYFVE
jgi:DNA-binding NarL/FixJ family response regulator